MTNSFANELVGARIAEHLGTTLAGLARDAATARLGGQNPIRYLYRVHGLEALRAATMKANGIDVWDPSMPLATPTVALPPQMRRDGIAVVVGSAADGTPVVATSCPFDYTQTVKIRRMIDPARLVYASPAAIQEVDESGHIAADDDFSDRLSDIAAIQPSLGQVADDDADAAPRAGTAIQGLLDRLFAAAAAARASDVHIEPISDVADGAAGGMRVRFRVDGRLIPQERLSVSGRHGAGVAATIARGLQMSAGVDIAAADSTDFRVSRMVGSGARVDARVHVHPCVIPTAGGLLNSSRTVIRILDARHRSLPELGMNPQLLARWRAVSRGRSGLALITGPTGAGKSTLAFGTLAEFVSPQIAAYSIEDPIELRLPDITQYEVTAADPAIRDARMTKALHDLRRQDADLVFVGEIRDRQSMALAFDLATSGIQVLATAHVGSAVQSVQKLLEWGVEPFLVASVLRAVLNVRLVHRLCEACRIPVTYADGESVWPRVLFGRPLPEQGWRTNPAGCSNCSGTGGQGRFLIGELLELRDVSVATLTNQQALGALGEGMKTLADEAVEAVISGRTDVASALFALGGGTADDPEAPNPSPAEG